MSLKDIKTWEQRSTAFFQGGGSIFSKGREQFKDEEISDLRAYAAKLEAENAELLKEVREWICDTCATVYPGPPQKGTSCVVCQNCKGSTGPRLRMEKRKLEADAATVRERALEEVKETLKAQYVGFGGPPDDPHPDAVLVNGTVYGCIEAVKALSAAKDQQSAHLQAAGPAVPDIDWLSNVIRAANGSNSLGAGALAEKIVEALAASQI
jgi:hypothetical protein